MLDFERFEALTFDCYGTLIDWETGILGALQPILRSHGVHVPDDELLNRFARLEAAAESGEYRPYREVLRSVVRGMGEAYGCAPDAAEQDRLPESIADWQPFPDTVESLRSLGTRYRLAVISNIDDDLFEATRRKLGVRFDRVVTAQLCRSYKPHRRNFNTMLALLDLPPERVLHVAESLYHDIKPARALGLTTVWINRRASRGGGAGASGMTDATPHATFNDLASLVRAAT